MNKVILRAITAYSRTDMKASLNGALAIKGREIEWLGKAYVLLEDELTQGLLAVYRCMNRGELKRLKRWPVEMTRPAASPATLKQPKASSVPALLELSPIKDPKEGAQVVKPVAKPKIKQANVSQTDLFE